MYLAGGEGEIDFPAFTSAALLGWDETTNTVDMLKWADAAGERMNALRELEQEPNMPLSHLALLTGARGPAFNCLTACAASTQAIGEATHILRRGDADVMIGGGTHSMIHPFGVTGFNRLTALCEDGKLKTAIGTSDPTRASRPFDMQRAGFVLGEGAGIVILETLDHALARGANILAEVAGYGSRCRPPLPMQSCRHGMCNMSTPTAPARARTTATKATPSNRSSAPAVKPARSAASRA
jgi:3-oxoacyl-[acyl-carrier-protein] synthase II